MYTHHPSRAIPTTPPIPIKKMGKLIPVRIPALEAYAAAPEITPNLPPRVTEGEEDRNAYKSG